MGGSLGALRGARNDGFSAAAAPPPKLPHRGAAAKHGAMLQAGAWVADPHFRFVTLTTLVMMGERASDGGQKCQTFRKGRR